LGEKKESAYHKCPGGEHHIAEKKERKKSAEETGGTRRDEGHNLFWAR